MAKKIAVGFDGSAGSRRALQEGIRLASLEKARLEVITVEELPRYPATVGEVIEEKDTLDERIKKLHDEARQIADEHGMQITTGKIMGHPAKALVEYCMQQKIELLILGHAGHSALWGTFLGTTADRVVQHAPCSVLIVR